jgi:mannitol-specific phosphotransferase system IIBC component
MRLLIAILLAAAVPLASAQTIIEKAKAEQAKKNAAAAKANAAQKKPPAAKKATQSEGEKMKEIMRKKGQPPAK